MSYIGNPPAERFTSFDYQDLTGGTGTSFTLTHPVGNAQEILVMVNNVVQEPGVAYTVSGTALTMTGSIASTDDFYVVYRGKAIQTATHPSDRALTATDGTFTGDASVTGDLTVDTDTLFVDASADSVGINQPSPSSSAALDIVGSTLVRGTSAGRTMALKEDGFGHLIEADTNSVGLVLSSAYSGGVVTFKTAGTERGRWLSSGGLTFNGDTAAANALDDYEEGTHVATVTGSNSGSATLNSSYNTLAYTKIGQIVHVTGLLIATSIASGSGYIKITLPFNVNGGYTARTAHPSLVNSSDVNVRDFVGITVQGEGFLRLYLGDGTALQDDSFQTLNANSSDIYVNVTYHT